MKRVILIQGMLHQGPDSSRRALVRLPPHHLTYPRPESHTDRSYPTCQSCRLGAESSGSGRCSVPPTCVIYVYTHQSTTLTPIPGRTVECDTCDMTAQKTKIQFYQGIRIIRAAFNSNDANFHYEIQLVNGMYNRQQILGGLQPGL